MDTLSDKLKGINDCLVTEVTDVSKDYLNERITATDKKETIKSSINVANYRAVSAVKSTVNEVLTVLKEERINPQIYERIKKLFLERL
jgi:hypothetical protein